MATQHATSEHKTAGVLDRGNRRRRPADRGFASRATRFSWRTAQLVVLVIALLPIALGTAFLAFVHSLERKQVLPAVAADGIVVLTGGRHRIGAGVDLLAKGKARRLLISGVHKHTSRRALSRHFPTRNRLYQCCIDLGRAALDTVGNASEAAIWTRLHEVRSLIVVTSSYHMPRALAEFRRAMPGVTMVPVAVVGKEVHLDNWWNHSGTTRLLVTEFAKYVPAVARLAIARLSTSRESPADPVASRPAGMS